MRKNRLLSFVLAMVMLFGVASALGATALAADVAINSKNFPDANFREFVKWFDTNKDGNLSASELAATTEMYCSLQNIASLKGIEHFTALTYLSCEINQLTSLDVSRNTALTYLNIGNNQLTSLDVSRNTALTELKCHGNQLTSLDVSRNTALTYLNCSSNQLTSLDVSRNTALTEFKCGDNQLTSLDVSHNTALTYLNCAGYQLTSLDVSHNTALTELDCSYNQLTSLDVSRNTALSALTCHNNNLTSLDVSTVPAICDAVMNGAKDSSDDSSYYHYKSTQGELTVDKTVTIVTGNTITGTVTVSPSNPTPNSTVTSSLGGALQNIPADKLHYQWQISRPNSTSFSDISGETGATMKIESDINPGYKFRLAVWADGFTGSVISNIVTVSETLTGTATISPSRPKPGETMTVALGGVLASIPADRLHYQWQSSSRAGAQLLDITGATGATYTVPADATSSYSFRVVITADGYAGSITSATVMLGGPALTGQVTISPSNPKVGDTLDASVRITTQGYTGRTLYQWQRSVDAGSSVFEDIPRATGSTYTPVQEDAGRKIRLSVSAGGYDGSIVSAPVTVAEDKTLSGTVTISPMNPAAGTTLSSDRSGGVADISVRDLNYQWQSKSNGRTFANVRGATSSTYTIPSSAEDGTQYRLMVTADGYTGTLYSNTVTVGGSSYQKGDVNMDGIRDNADLILVARYVVNLYNFSSEAFKLGDMDDSGVIDNSDLIRLARLLVGLS